MPRAWPLRVAAVRDSFSPSGGEVWCGGEADKRAVRGSGCGLSSGLLLVKFRIGGRPSVRDISSKFDMSLKSSLWED